MAFGLIMIVACIDCSGTNISTESGDTILLLYIHKVQIGDLEVHLRSLLVYQYTHDTFIIMEGCTNQLQNAT